jgi:HlyD family secretion protein
LAAVLLAGAAAAGFLLPGDTQPAVAAPGHSTAGTAVGALGRIEPASEVIAIGAPFPDRIESWTVGEGDAVIAGQILGYLGAYRERIAERDMTAAKLRDARHLADAESATYDAAVHEANIRIEEIRRTFPLKIAAQEAKVRAIEVELANNVELLKQSEELLRSQTRSKQSVNDLRTQTRRSEEDLNSARAALAELRDQMGINVEKAQNDIERAKASFARATATAGVEGLEKQLALAEASAEHATIRAPIAGRILKIMAWPGERAGEKPLLQMGDTSHMHAVAEVYETDIGRVRIGQTATIASPALARPLTGKVVRIGNMIFKNDVLSVDPTADADARVVEVRIDLDDPAPVRSLSRLTVDVLIQTAKAAVAAGAAAPAR